MRLYLQFMTGIVALVLGTVYPASGAESPVDQLLPDTTRLALLLPDYSSFKQRLAATQFGRIWRDPKMKDFADSFTAWPDALRPAIKRFGEVEFSELDRVASGEACFAVIERAAGEPVPVLVLGVAGKTREAAALVQEAVNRLSRQGAEVTSREVSGVQMTVAELRTGEVSGKHSVFLIRDSRLIMVGDLDCAEAMVARWTGPSTGSMAELPAYQDVMSRCRSEAGDTAPQVIWFIDPVALTELGLAGDLEDDELSPVQYAERHGFDGVRGVGGFVYLADRGFDLHYHIVVSAPGPFHSSMKMFQFSGGNDLSPSPWVPADVSAWTTASWKFSSIIENCGKLYDDEFVGVDGSFARFLQDMKSPAGPGVDLGADLFAYLGPRLTLISELVLPLAEQSERSLIAIHTKKQRKVALALKRLLRNEPDVTRLNMEGFNNELWQIPGAGSSSTSLMVANGRLNISTSSELLRKSLQTAASGEQLAAADAYRRIAERLDKYMSGEATFFCTYAWPQKDYHAAYEFLRSGKAEESDSIYVTVLSSIWDLQAQNVVPDFSRLPAFPSVRHYLGPVGIVGKVQQEGWLFTGFTLPTTD